MVEVTVTVRIVDDSGKASVEVSERVAWLDAAAMREDQECANGTATHATEKAIAAYMRRQADGEALKA